MPEQNSSTSSFKQFLLRILLPLIAILSCTGLLFNHLFEQKIILDSQLCGAYKVNRIINQTHANEIPIFGSSRAEYALLPDSLGDNYFNYGLAGTKYNVTLFFLEHELKKTKTNPYIIINFDLDGLTYGIGDVSNYILNASDPAVRSLLDSEYKYYFSIPFLKYYGRYENYLRLYFSNKIELTQITNKGAALDKNLLSQKEFNALVAERKNTKTVFKNDPALQQKLLSLIAGHPERQFIFVVAPYHSSFFEQFQNLSEARSFLNILRATGNVHVVDCSSLPLADSMFLNTTHVNYKGAMIYNKALRDSLRALMPFKQ